MKVFLVEDQSNKRHLFQSKQKLKYMQMAQCPRLIDHIQFRAKLSKNHMAERAAIFNGRRVRLFAKEETV